MSIILLPDRVTFKQWMVDLIRTKPTLIVPIPTTQDSTDWRKWAMLLISMNKKMLGKICLPSKSQFPKDEDWRKWAYFFIQNTTL